MSFRLLRLAPLGALLLLMGCSSKILVCPVPAILADTQSVTIFRPGTVPDMANELYTVSLINSTGDCTYSTRDGVVHASLELTFRMAVSLCTPRPPTKLRAMRLLQTAFSSLNCLRSCGRPG